MVWSGFALHECLSGFIFHALSLDTAFSLTPDVVELHFLLFIFTFCFFSVTHLLALTGCSESAAYENGFWHNIGRFL